MPAPAQLLFVCTGNICRSPFAERIAQLRAQQFGLSGWEFASAGVGALVGAQMEPLMAAELRARGGDPDGFHSRQINRTMLLDAALVLPLQKAHRRVILDEVPRIVRRVHTLGQVAHRTAQAPASLTGADYLAAVEADRSPTRTEYDIDDPYRQGPQKAAEVAELIDRAVTVVLARLAGNSGGDAVADLAGQQGPGPE